MCNYISWNMLFPHFFVTNSSNVAKCYNVHELKVTY